MNVSVIIPAFNEEKIIEKTLGDLVANHGPYEIIVVDGGSTDATCQLASQNAKVISCGKQGRGSQMNLGAEHAKGEILLFLHADTTLPKEGLQKIKEVISHGKSCGRFRDSFQPSCFILNFYAFFTRFHFFSYGDQGFFVSAKLFKQLQGFCEDAPFEDMHFYSQLSKIATPIIIKDPVITSSRRFIQTGIVKQAAIDLFFIILYQLGCYSLLNYYKQKWYPDIR